MIDLRSDTVTRPTPGMREVMAGAEVGDDVLGDDPTVRELEERVAALLGKERSLFFPSGIMANETAILIQGRPGTEAVVEGSCHLVDWEDAAVAAWAGMQLRTVPTPDGVLTPEAVRAAIRPDTPVQPRTSLVCLENTHNAAGGKVAQLEMLLGVADVAREAGLPVHLDGARLWNASVASGVPLGRYGDVADTVMVSLSKGLGCPVGSMLAGSMDLMAEAWRIRRRLGGGMRQSGILAAAGLYALDHNVERLAEDHRRARLLAGLAAEIPGVRVSEPDTNIVMMDLAEAPASRVVAELASRGVGMTPFAAHRLRAVTHMDVDDDGIRAAASALAGVLAAA